MLSKLIYKMKQSKLFFALVIVLGIALLFDIFIVIYDTVQFIALLVNSANFFKGLWIINGVATAINFLVLVFGIICFFVLRSVKN